MNYSARSSAHLFRNLNVLLWLNALYSPFENNNRHNFLLLLHKIIPINYGCSIKSIKVVSISASTLVAQVALNTRLH